MKILQVNTLDEGGGAAKVAHKLFEAYRDRGHRSWMAVGVKRKVDSDIFTIENAAGAGLWARPWWRLHDRMRPRPGRGATVADVAEVVASPRKILRERRGLEDFEYPGTRRLLELTPTTPDVVNLHNLHGAYFDLRELPRLSRSVPLVTSLHDPWMFTGHC